MEREYEPECGEEPDDEYGEYSYGSYEYGEYDEDLGERFRDQVEAEFDAECKAVHWEKNHWKQFDTWCWAVKREEVYLRDKGICDVCGLHTSWSEYQCGHIQDRDWGGSDNMDNLVVMHQDCNRYKPPHLRVTEYIKWRDKGKRHPKVRAKFRVRFAEQWPKMSPEEKRVWMNKAFWRWSYAQKHGGDW